jgi:energy-coupling factor transporter transmembrane protein EcfT
MKNPTSLFRYRPALTPVHRIPAGFKFAALLAVTVSVSSSGISLLSVLSTLILALSATAKVPAHSHIANARIIFLYFLMVCAFRFIGKPLNDENFPAQAKVTVVYIWQLALVLLSGTVFYETTSALEIRHMLAGIQKSAQKAINAIYSILFRTSKKKPDLPDIAFLLSLTITFIPRIFDSWSLMNRAWDARGGREKRGFAGAWSRFTVLVPALFLKLFAVASDTDRAIRNRSA